MYLEIARDVYEGLSWQRPNTRSDLKRLFT